MQITFCQEKFAVFAVKVPHFFSQAVNCINIIVIDGMSVLLNVLTKPQSSEKDSNDLVVAFQWLSQKNYNNNGFYF